MTLRGGWRNLHQTIQQHTKCRELEFVTVSVLRPTHGEQVCSLKTLLKPWQLHRNPEATAQVLASEERSAAFASFCV